MKQSGFGIASLVLGIVSILLACVGVGIFPAILGFIFAIIGLISRNRKHGTAIAGLICSIVGAVFFLFAFLVADSILGSDDEESPKKVETVEQSEAETGNEETEVEANDEETKTEVNEKQEAEAVDNTFSIGEVVETSDLKISFLSAGEYVSDNEFIQPKEGCVYYRMEFEFENISDSDQYVTSYEWECYADSYAVDQTWIGDDDLSATLSPGKKAKGSLYFEVPAGAQEITLEYKTNFWTEDKVVFMVK